MPLLPKEKKSVRIFIGLLVFQLVLISFQVPLGSRPTIVEKAVFGFLTPVGHGVSAVFRFLGRLWRVYFFHLGVERQNQDLRRETFFLRQENDLMRRKLESYRSREETLNYLSEMHQRIRLARVINLDPLSYKSSLIIDQGRLAEVKKDMVVVDRFGNLVGRVIEPLSLTESTVQLITDETSGVGVAIQGEKGVGVLSGDGQGGCRLKYILGTAEGIVPGDEVYTSGFDGIFPPGLRVGRVVTIGRDETLFLNLVVRPHFSFRRLSRLAVLIAEDKPKGPSGGGE